MPEPPPTCRPRTTLATTLITIAVLAAAAARGAQVPPWIASHPLRRIKSETLVYRVTAKTFLGTMNLGTVTFTLSRENVRKRTVLVLRAYANGGPPTYPFESTITARLWDDDYRQIEVIHHRVKPEYKERWLRWHKRGVDSLKHKHCEAPTLCHNARHLITRSDGSKVHCPKCYSPEHFVWSLRERHRFRGRSYGFIAAIYMTRGFDGQPGGGSSLIRVVSNRDRWDVAVRAAKEKTVSVPAGDIACYRPTFKLTPLSRHSKKHAKDFEGPFGLHGNIRLYADKDSKHLVLITGEVKLGMSFDIRVELLTREVEYFD